MLEPPRSPADLNPEWLTAALRQGGYLGSNRVVGATASPIGVGRGWVGLTLRVELEYDHPDPDAPASLVAKLPNPLRTDLQSSALNAVLYGNEINFYMHLAGMTPVRTPACYWAAGAPDDGRFGLLLEDLTPLAVLDQTAACDDDTARSVVVLAADLHGRWWNHPDLGAEPWLSPPQAHARFAGSLFSQSWPIFRAEFGATFGREFVAIGDRLASALPGLIVDAAATASTLLHGDFRIDNFLFGPNGEITVLDWQLCGRGSGPLDLAYFVSQSLPTGTRRRLAAELLRSYHQRLLENGVKGYSSDACRTDYLRGLLVALAVPANGIATVARAEPPDAPAARAMHDSAIAAGRQFLATIAERAVRAVLEEGAEEVLA